MSSSPRSSTAAVELVLPASCVAPPRVARDLFVVGCGVLGSVLVEIAVRAGLTVAACDFDLGAPENLPRQRVEVGVAKAVTVARTSNAIRPGAAVAYVRDVRQVGIGELRKHRMLMDASDDQALRLTLSKASNGLGIPLFRAAVDGTGQRALGRTRVSHGGRGRSCLCCHAARRDLAQPGRRTPCPGGARVPRPPTRAGVPIATAIAALALHGAQGLLAGREDVLDREIYLDLDGACLAGTITRDEGCASGHEVWQLEPLERSAADTTLGELFALAARALGAASVRLEPFGNPIAPSTWCPGCGEWKLAPGSLWAPPPCCACGALPERRAEMALSELTEPAARLLGALDRTCLDLGLPPEGALITARAPGGGIRRFVLL